MELLGFICIGIGTLCNNTSLTIIGLFLLLNAHFEWIC